MDKKGIVSRFLLIEPLCRNQSKFLTSAPSEVTAINQTGREQYCLFIFSMSAPQDHMQDAFFHLKWLTCTLPWRLQQRRLLLHSRPPAI